MKFSISQSTVILHFFYINFHIITNYIIQIIIVINNNIIIIIVVVIIIFINIIILLMLLLLLLLLLLQFYKNIEVVFNIGLNLWLIQFILSFSKRKMIAI